MRLLSLLLLVALAVTGCTAAPTPPAQVSLVLIATDPSSLLVADARAVAADLGATLEVVDTSDVQGAVDAALIDSPDVIIGVGDEVLDVVDPAAASTLAQQFLLLGAQALEPTENLTASVFRDYEGYYLAGVAAGVAGHAAVTAPPASPLVDSSVSRFSDGLHSVAPSLDPVVTVGDDLDFGCRITTDYTVGLREPLERILAGDAGGVYSYGVADKAVAIDGCPGSDSPEVQAAAAALSSGELEVTDPLFFE